MERTLSIDGTQGRADRDARRARRRRAPAARAGVGRPAGPADRVRPRLVAVPAVLVAADRRPARRGLPARHVRPPRPRHVGAAAGRRALRRRAALGRRPQRGDRAAGAGPPGAGRVVLRRVRRHRLPRAPTARTAIAGVDLVGGAVLRTPSFDHIGPGLLENAGDACGPDLPTSIAAIRRFLRACTARPLGDRRLEHGAVLEHGRGARGPRGAVRARDRRRRRPRPACPCRCSSPTGAPTRSCCPRWPSTCSRSARRRGPPGTTASATCRSWRTPAGSTASSASSPDTSNKHSRSQARRGRSSADVRLTRASGQVRVG